MSDERSARPRASLKALERGLDVLDYLFAVPEEALGAISEHTKVPPSSLHRLLRVLEEHGYVTSGGGRYQLGTKGLWLTSSRDAIRQILSDLSHNIGETANFAVLVQDEVEFLERAVSDHPLSFVVSVGSRVPLSCSGLGKAILAFRPDMVDQLTLRAVTSRSITDPVELRAELEVARHRGFSLDNEECVEGVYCIAAPVFDRQGEAVAAVSLSGPVVRFSRERAFEAASRLKASSDRISRLFK